MNRSLYDDNYRYTSHALNLDEETKKVLRPMMNLLLEKGFSPREIGQVMEASVQEIVSEVLLDPTVSRA